MLIHTSKFRLLSMEFEHLEAIIAGQNRLQEILNVTVPANWPIKPEAFAALLNTKEECELRIIHGWWFFFIFDRVRRDLVGATGFRGFPDSDGRIEVGYELTPAFSREMVDEEILKSLIGFAFTRPSVQSVILRSAGSLNKEYVRVLRNIGMTKYLSRKAEIEWRVSRDAYES